MYVNGKMTDKIPTHRNLSTVTEFTAIYNCLSNSGSILDMITYVDVYVCVHF